MVILALPAIIPQIEIAQNAHTAFTLIAGGYKKPIRSSFCFLTAPVKVRLTRMKGKLPMPGLIKQESVVFDAWKLLILAANESAETVNLPVGPLLVPVSVWHARRRELVEREYAHGWPLGVWLAAAEGPKAIADDVDDFSVVAVHFPKTTDGRGCFTARLLRERHGYRGELRAFGEVSREQLVYLQHSGFGAFTLRADRVEAAPVGAPHASDQGDRAAAGQPRRLAASEYARLETARAA